MFGKNKNQKDGVDFRCKTCRSEASAKYRAEHPGKNKTAVEKWKKENLEWTKTYSRQYYEANIAYHQDRYAADPEASKKRTKQWQKDNPEAVAHIRRQTRYGLSRQQYVQMVEEANGVCKLCGEKPKRLVVDHNHATGKVRGLICDFCNKGLGLMKDDIETILKAAEYLILSAAKTPNPSESHS